MANPVLGEVSFVVDGDTYTLVLDFNALCTLRQRTGIGAMKLNALFEEAAKTEELPPEDVLRSVFWAGLELYHPELTEREAGSLIGRYGLTPAVEKIGESLAAAFPNKGDANAPAGPPPAPPVRTPRSGTTRRSTRSGAG